MSYNNFLNKMLNVKEKKEEETNYKSMIDYDRAYIDLDEYRNIYYSRSTGKIYNEWKDEVYISNIRFSSHENDKYKPWELYVELWGSRGCSNFYKTIEEALIARKKLHNNVDKLLRSLMDIDDPET